jgi:hypothetical protein
MMMVGRLFGVKDETICRTDCQCGIEGNHPDRERSNPALHG